MYFDAVYPERSRGVQYKQKGFVQFIILGIVVLAVVAAGAFYVGKQTATPKPQPQSQVVTSQPSPTPTSSPAPTITDETANWKTYTDNERGFLLKYPPDWDNAFDYCSTPVNANSNELSANCIKTVIFTSDIPSENADLGRDLVLTSTTNIKISGYNAKREIFSLPDDNTPDTYQVWIYKNNKPFILWLSYIGVNTSKKQADAFVNILNKILSTFKFLDKN